MKKSAERKIFYAEPVQEIMGRQPAWIVRWGITVLVAILVGIIVISSLIKYPRTIVAAISLTSDNPSSDLTARYAGILDSVSVSNGDTVRKGQILATIVNSANYTDVRWLGEVLMDPSVLEERDVNRIAACQERQMGDLQPYWLELRSACRDYVDYMRIDQIGKKKRLLGGQLQQMRNHYVILERQRTNLEAELSYEYQSLNRDSILWAQMAISRAEYEDSAKEYIARKNSLDGFDATLSSARLGQLQLEQQILELDIQQSAEMADHKNRISRAKEVLLGHLSIWYEQYVIIAPCDGIVSLQNVWSKGQHVMVGDLIASVSPAGGATIIGRLKVPSSGFGKVKLGQEVNIKLNGFPYLEFGILKGVVRSISPVPEKTQDGLFYTVDVELPAGLESTYHKVFPFVQEMDGTAEIITENLRLIQQFTDPIRSLFRNR